MENRELFEKLNAERRLNLREWEQIFCTYDEADLKSAMDMARDITVKRFGKKIFFRGIVEFTNVCKNDCYYCGIRAGNSECSRYRLEEDDIIACCEDGYNYGFRTFVLQGGEDPYYTRDKMCHIVKRITERFPDCAVTLSIGELDRDFYQALYDAGAARFLLRHESADAAHYALLHPESQTLASRMRCLKDLKEIGFQTGCGIMVGSPHQTGRHLAEDMMFMTEFQPEMVGRRAHTIHDSARDGRGRRAPKRRTCRRQRSHAQPFPHGCAQKIHAV